MNQRRSIIEEAGSRIAFVWAGLLIGGSLIAAPAKFQVSSLSLTTALEIGQVTFLWTNIAEGVCAAALLVCIVAGRRLSGMMLLLAPIVLFAIQQIGIMPSLGARTEQVIAGAELPPSSLHTVYIVFEVGKLLALLLVGTWPLLGNKTNSDRSQGSTSKD